MSFFPWHARYSIGVPEVDEQHRFLVGLVDEFYEAMQAGKGRKLVGDLLLRLAEYTQYHFATEERLMTEHAYPALAEHLQEHDVLRRKVAALLEEAQTSDVAISAKVGIFLRDWLRKHIAETDRALGQYLNR